MPSRLNTSGDPAPHHCSSGPSSGPPSGLVEPVDLDCLARVPARVMLAEDWMPVRHDPGCVVIAAAADLDEFRLRSSVDRWFPGVPVHLVRVDRPVVHDAVIAGRAGEVADEMANTFTRRFPEFAAKPGLATWQKVLTAVLGAGALAALAGGWGAAVFATTALIPVAGMLFKTALAAWAPRPTGADGYRPELCDDELPTYTILLAAYDESYVIAETLRAICAMDYPKEKVEVLLLLEHDDVATIRAVRESEPPDNVRIVMIPPGQPHTKPRAANLGLLLARGDLTVIFDADDRPEPDQLRRVADRFARGDERLAAVQARLNFYNRDRTLLTRLFSIEYMFQWDLVYAALGRLRLPLPLGGTSNHIRTDVLREVGGWDAWNVTEDADLGMRLAALGYRSALSGSVTWEEAPVRTWPWIKQRTRWLKGHQMTLAVHTRRPWRSLRRFGVSGLIGLIGIVGGSPLISMLLPLPYLGFACRAMTIDVGGRHVGVAPAAALVSAATTALYLLSHAYTLAARRRGWLPLILLIPGYWLLACVAGWRALFQLLRAPYQWEKTAHGSPSAGRDPAPP